MHGVSLPTGIILVIAGDNAHHIDSRATGWFAGSELFSHARWYFLVRFILLVLDTDFWGRQRKNVMTPTEVLTLFVYLSVKNPARAARRLIDFRITRQMLWSGLILMAILNTLMQQLSNFLIPGPSLLPGITDVAFIYFIFVIGGLVSIVFAIYFVGRTFGGRGSVSDVMIVIIWLQFLRLLVQVLVLFFLFFKLPTLSLLVVLAGTIFGFWILIHFVNQAHSFESLGKSVLILAASFGGLLVAWSLVASLVGFGLLEATRV